MTTMPMEPAPPPTPGPYAPSAPPLAQLRGPAAVSLFFVGLVTLVQLAQVALALVIVGDGPATPSGFGVFYALDALSVLTLLALVGAYVGSCLWLYRAHAHAEIVRPLARRARKKGWAWAGWLVPVVCLWFPFQVLRDASLDPDQSGSRPTVRGWWWASFLAFSLTERVADRIYTSASPATAMDLLLPAEVVSAVFAVAAFALWARVVRTTTRDHEQAARTTTEASAA